MKWLYERVLGDGSEFHWQAVPVARITDKRVFVPRENHRFRDHDSIPASKTDKRRLGYSENALDKAKLLREGYVTINDDGLRTYFAHKTLRGDGLANIAEASLSPE